MKFKRISVTVSLVLLGVIGFAIFDYSPSPVLYDPPVFNGSYWSERPDIHYLTYRALKGDLRLEQVQNRFGFHTTDGMTYRIQNITYYALDTGDTVYYLVNHDRRPYENTTIQGLLDASKVYLNGNIFKYSHWDGSILYFVKPMEFSDQPILDLGERAKNIIIDIHGAQYFRRYFTKPIIWKDGYDPNEAYEVLYQYNSSQEQRNEYVSLYFNEDKMLVYQEDLPNKSSRLPFKISKEDVREIVISSGFECNVSSDVSLTWFSQHDDWYNPEGEVQIETYYNPEYCAHKVNLSRYVWNVRLKSEINTEEEYTVHNYALIDVNTGEILVVDNYRVNWNPWRGWWGISVEYLDE